VVAPGRAVARALAIRRWGADAVDVVLHAPRAAPTAELAAALARDGRALLAGERRRPPDR
jgi:hypothetical protein